jgi:lysophospholipase L1-like esterase
MAVSSTLNKQIYTGNGTTKIFDYTFYTLAEGDLKLYLTNITTGAETEITTNYDVSPAGDGFPTSSGTVTYPVVGDPITSNYKFTILRTMDGLQPTVYDNNTSLKPKVIEKSFDRITMIAQQQQEELTRVLTNSISADPNVSNELPIPVPLHSFRWDVTGLKLETTLDPSTAVDAANIAKVAAQEAQVAAELAEDNSTTQAGISTNAATIATTQAGNAANSADAANLSALSTTDIAFTTKALMDADLAHEANITALVTNDTTSTNNGIYIKLGASGAGSWQKSDYIPPVALEAVAYRNVVKGTFFSKYQKGNVFKNSLNPLTGNFIPVVGNGISSSILLHGDFLHKLDADNVIGLFFDNTNSSSQNSYYYKDTNIATSTDGGFMYNISDLGLIAGDTINFGIAAICTANFSPSNANFTMVILEYDSSGSFIKSSSTSGITPLNTFSDLVGNTTLSTSASKILIYLKVGYILSGVNTITMEICNIYITKDTVNYQIVINHMDRNKYKTLWYDKKWSVVGDSITAPFLYPTYANTELGFSILNNYGVSGSRITHGSGSIAVYDRMTTFDCDVDVMTIFAGINDYHASVHLGDINSTDITQFYGSYNAIVEYILTQNPLLRLVLVACMQKNDTSETSGLVANSAGLYPKDYRNATKNIAEKFGLPFIDMYTLSGINIYTSETLLKDGLHPNEAGNHRIAEVFAGFLKTI